MLMSYLTVTGGALGEATDGWSIFGLCRLLYSPRFNLLMRFVDVTEGQITIDGLDIREVTQASLRAQMDVVHQDTS